MELRVGPVVLSALEPVARGGTATVWRGRHVDAGIPVALKVLLAERLADPSARRMILDEVLRASTLDHPAVLRILDYGTIRQDLDPRLPVGAPYLVMEWADLGALALSPGGVRHWSTLRATLVTLLGALAHVHARGLLHRDLKPGNVLCCGDQALRPGLKLADLGLAALREDAASGPRMFSMGYAPPEQLDPARSHEQGPWTDLYALGALATALIAGGRPVPDLLDQLPLPPGAPPALPQWLATLLAPSPLDRFPTAAAALVALEGLHERSVDALPPGRTTIRTDDYVRPTQPWPLPSLPADPPPPAPPVPAPLRTAEQPLLAARPPRLVSRRASLARLWRELQSSVAAHACGRVLVQGPRGVGKSRLVDELCWRAAEAAGVPSLRVLHGPQPDDRSGLAPALRRALGIEGLGDRARQQRLLELLLALDRGGAPHLQLIDSVLQDRTTSPGARANVLAWALGVLGRGGPVLLILEDAEWAEDSLAVAECAHQAGQLPPGLLLRVQAQGQAGPGELDLALEPMTTAELEELLLQAAPGQVALCRRVVDQAHGRLQAARLLLVRALGASSQLPLPELAADPGAPWRAVLSGLEAGDRACLVAAVAFGLRVPAETWPEVCQQLGLALDPTLADRLVRAGFWGLVPGGWAFADPFALQVVVDAPGSFDLLASAHAACAALELEEDAVDHARLGLHLLAAGRRAQAVEHLETGAERALLASDYARAERLAGALHQAGGDRGRACLLEIRAASGRGRHHRVRELADPLIRDPQSSPRTRAAALHYRAIATGRAEPRDELGAEALLRWASSEAERSGDQRLQARVKLEQASRCRERDPEQAVGLVHDARRLFEALEDAHGQADALAAEADLLLQAGAQPDRAESLLAQALQRYEAIGNVYGLARTRNSMGDALRQRGRWAEALEQYAAAGEAFQRVGSPELATAGANRVLVLLARGEDRLVLAEVRALEAHVTEGVAVLRPYLGLAAATAAARLGDRVSFDAVVATWLGGRLDLATQDRELAELLAQARRAARHWLTDETDP